MAANAGDGFASGWAQGVEEGDGREGGHVVPSCESACQPIATVVIVVVALAGNFIFAK